jgi:hypothetical protein
LTIPEDGAVFGFGELRGNVLVEGTFVPGFDRHPRYTHSVGDGNPIGTWTVTGNFTLAPSGVLDMDVKNPTRHDMLRVNGPARLLGSLWVDMRGYKPRVGDRIPIMRAGRILGRFARVRTSLPRRYTVEFVKVGGLGMLVIGEKSSPELPPPPTPVPLPPLSPRGARL